MYSLATEGLFKYTTPISPFLQRKVCYVLFYLTTLLTPAIREGFSVLWFLSKRRGCVWERTREGGRNECNKQQRSGSSGNEKNIFSGVKQWVRFGLTKDTMKMIAWIITIGDQIANVF
jgi:hypothetical protein